MQSEKTMRRHWRYLEKHKWFDVAPGELKQLISRKTKKFHFSTKRRERQDELHAMHRREQCNHDGEWETSWSPIAGEEWRLEPDYDYCAECGMTEMEIDARQGNVFWQKRYPKKKANRRERAVTRLTEVKWRSSQQKYIIAERVLGHASSC